MKKQILLADDNPTIRKVLKLMIEKGGKYEVTPVTSGTEAYNHLTQNPVDAVVTDDQMPDGRGLDFIKKARANGYTLPIILVSGTADVEEALEAKADRFLQKPVTYITLLKTLDELLQ